MTSESPDHALAAAADDDAALVANPPGLDALIYRVGTHASFKAAMVQALSRKDKLRSLARAETDDPTLALVDAWASTLDVLTFYQERIANEGYLRTATERRSMQELGRAVGYELNPGVAAETYLAFTLDDGPGAPEKVTIEAGTKVQSVPGPGEQAQIFETVEAIEARPEWNLIKPLISEVRWPAKDDTEVCLKGTNTGLNPGDGILFVGDERKGNAGNQNWDFRRVKSVEPDGVRGCTKVTWDEELGHFDPPVDPAENNPEVHAFRLRAAFFGHNAPDWKTMPLSVMAAYHGKTEDEFKAEAAQTGSTLISGGWPKFSLWEISKNDNETSPYTIQLDSAYPQIRPGPDSWLVLAAPDYVELYEVQQAVEDAQANFTLSSKTTRVTLKGENLKEKFDKLVRETMVFAQSEELNIGEALLSEFFPDETQTNGVREDKSTITLDRRVDGLYPGMKLLITGLPGTRQDIQVGDESAVSAELVTLLSAEPDSANESNAEESRTVITITPPLTNTYVRDSVTIHPNVARATHGETRQEVLGSADAARSFQQFALRQAPLTFTPAATPTGGVGTLEVRVNDLLWDEKATLYGAGPRDRVFTAGEGADGRVIVQFGDGATGARPPRGDENIHATYRIGLGSAGNVKADQLRGLLTRPLGVRGVSNPQAATGGADREDPIDARRNAPCTALTLDRIVSLHDYEDFARAFGGVGKARADWLWDGSRGVVFITVVAPDGKEIDKATLDRLRAGIDAARDPAQHVRVETKEALTFKIAARLVIKPEYRHALVLDAARKALREAFTLNRRDFGRDVTESDILGLLQAVDGVEAVDVEEPYPERGSDSEWKSQRRLAASGAHATPLRIEPAELLLLDPSPGAVSLRAVPDLSKP